MFNNLGKTPEVTEEKLEAYAIITAMGPTYFWPQWLQLQKLGQDFGLTDEELRIAMPSMLNSSVDILYHSEFSSEEVLDLIPVYPLKDNEVEINQIFQNKLTGLHNKLKGK